MKPEFDAADTVVLGVSPDAIESHQSFAAKHGLNFPLLADVDRAVCARYGVWQEKSFMGKTSMGVVRATFVVDKQGILQHIDPKVKVDGHMAAMLEIVRKL